MTALDLFACAGGATTGIAMLGRHVVGIDHDPDACATHAAAGHPTIRADLTAPVPVSGPFEMVWASPPCTAFSMAGRGAGREVSDVLVGRILAEDWTPMEGHDPTVWLVLPTMAALLELGPTAIGMENVPPTLPVMHACAQVLERHGWHTAVGVLSAERFGVAQTRKRAFLIANRERRVQMPEPTHQGYGNEVDDAQGSLFGEPLLPWISMAEALGWGVPEHRKTAGQKGCSTNRPVAMDRRTISRGAGGTRVPTVTVPVTSPSPSLTSSGVSGQFVWVGDGVVRGDDPEWPDKRPATSIAGDPRVFQPGGHHTPGAQSQNSISISISEAARLQAFPNGHPWQGSRSSIFRQIGNAVPPPVAAAVAGAALGIDWRPAVADYLAELYSQPLEREAAA